MFFNREKEKDILKKNYNRKTVSHKLFVWSYKFRKNKSYIKPYGREN